jgi:gliding motility-associated-like protein
MVPERKVTIHCKLFILAFIKNYVVRLSGKSILIFLTIFFFRMVSARAQLCQGSLGDPVVNITFGAGANPGPPLQAATTGYQFLGADCPNDGFYTVRSNNTNCFNNSWHNLTADHTGDPNGYYMLVNASYQPSAFYLDTVKGLCAGTTYEFAAWIANVMRPSACGSNGIKPNITFSIERTDGSLLQSYTTGDIPSLATPTWQQFGFFFATPTGVSDIVLRMVNNSPGGCGNDIALDDITFRPCGPKLNAVIVGNTATEVTICEGTTASFTLGGDLSSGFNNPERQWQKSFNGGPWTDIIASPTSPQYIQNFLPTTPPGIYAYRLTAAEAGNMSSTRCRVASNSIIIKVSPSPKASVTSNSPVCEKTSLSLSASGGTTYQWMGPNNFTASSAAVSISNAQGIHSGKYYVLVKEGDCAARMDSVMVTVKPAPTASAAFSQVRICEGETVMLGSSGGDLYKWMPATGLSSVSIPNPVAKPTDTIVYRVVVTNSSGCQDTAAITVNVIEKPRANAGPDKYIIKGKVAQLQAEVTGQNTSYSWSPDFFIDDIKALTPVVNPPQDTSYLLTAVSNDGCGSSTDMVHVYLYPDIYVPNAFSPNGDGRNDTWFIPSLRAYSEFTVSIYNRYGQLIFHTKNTMNPWDGTFNGRPQPASAYVYVVDIKGGERILKGTLVLVR